VGAWILERLRGAGVPKPDPRKPLGTEWYFQEPGKHSARLLILLPGRRDRASDFARRGFITLARKGIPDLDCVAVNATLGYYLDGSVADRLQREIIAPARTLGYRETWILGVSMGGLGALFHERTYPGQIRGLFLLAPFVGDDLKLFAEIDAAGGPGLWAASQPAPDAELKKSEFQRELWNFLGRMPLDQGQRLEIWLAYGEDDRLLPGIQRLKSLVLPGRIFPLPGGHSWEIWKTGFTRILAAKAGSWAPNLRKPA
jgi:pimeloyl-ACP methyl ester carboxylesterase